MLRRMMPVLLFLSVPAHALTTWQIGTGIQASYNSKIIQPVTTTNGLANLPTGDALTLSVSPFLTLQTETGRITEMFRIQFLADGILLLQGLTPTYSYQTTASSLTRVDLTSRLAWTVGVLGTQGKVNSFAQSQDPSLQLIQGINVQTTDFLTVGANSLIGWDPTARLHITQPIDFNGYIPYSIDSNVTGAVRPSPSYTLNAGLGLDHQWARFSLGTELRVGWFLPQTGQPLPGQDDPSVVTGQLIGRGKFELAPRWTLDASAGVFVATQASHFFQGQRTLLVTVNCTVQPQFPACQNGQATMVSVPEQVDSTLVSPIGALALSYLFPSVSASLGLAYMHQAAGEVLLGRLTVSDSVSLRAFLPLPRNLALSASAGYRYAQLSTSGGFSTTQTDGTPLGQSYNLYQFDGSLTWKARDYLYLFVRYQYINQMFSGSPAPGDLALVPFDRHLATLGLALTYPPR